jgi:hypothetical protein
MFKCLYSSNMTLAYSFLKKLNQLYVLISWNRKNQVCNSQIIPVCSYSLFPINMVPNVYIYLKFIQIKPFKYVTHN